MPDVFVFHALYDFSKIKNINVIEKCRKILILNVKGSDFWSVKNNGLNTKH